MIEELEKLTKDTDGQFKQLKSQLDAKNSALESVIMANNEAQS